MASPLPCPLPSLPCASPLPCPLPVLSVPAHRPAHWLLNGDLLNGNLLNGNLLNDNPPTVSITQHVFSTRHVTDPLLVLNNNSSLKHWRKLAASACTDLVPVNAAAADTTDSGPSADLAAAAGSGREEGCPIYGSDESIGSAASLRPAFGAARQRPAGLDRAWEQLTFGFVKPLLGQGLFQSLQAPSGALLHGPPGTGKTMLALHALTSNDVKYVYLKASDIHSKYTGVSERIIADAFKEARRCSPAVLLIDELDCVFPARSSEAGSKHPSILSQLLVELDSAREQRVALLATTNCPEDLDPALLRRLPLRIGVPLPGKAARRSVLELWIKTKVEDRHKLTDAHLNRLARDTEGDIANMVDEAIFRLAHKMSTADIPQGSRRLTKLPPLTIRYFKLPDSAINPNIFFRFRGGSKPKAQKLCT
ncbi:hypothetical protein OC846_006624 [Tilletia horrida]|uniref:AAA+ ATPase domain-containing protein n=1 Tax=Tilletia horrida TaxID=155126 RepID=A0AAN6GJ65_9BASI|nr:hypothetical protein OC846_006624 [Tilletia horrida]